MLIFGMCFIMLAVNYTNLRDKMKMYMDKVTDDYETMIITRKNHKNVPLRRNNQFMNLMQAILYYAENGKGRNILPGE